MTLHGIDLNLLVAFDAIRATRSISLAAAQLGLRQPAVSGALARLRKLFGDELFVRAGGEMQATPKALQIAPAVEAALAQLRQALNPSLAFDPAGTAQTFTIASTDYTTTVLLPPFLAALENEAPDATLRIVGYDKDDIGALIDRGVIDLALGVFQKPPERSVRQRLCRESFVGVARAGHPALADGAMTLDAWLRQRHALVSVRRDAIGEIDRLLAERGLARRIVVTLPHMLALPALLASSDLVTALPGRIAARFSGAGLVSFPLPLPMPAWRIEMLWNPQARNDQANAWLRSRISAIAAAL